MKYLSSSVQLEDTSEWERRKFFGFIGIHKCFVSRTPKNAATLFSYLYVKFCQCRRFKSLFKRLKASEIGNQQYEKWSKVFKTCSSLSFSASLSVIPAFSLESISWTFFFFFLSCCWQFCFLPKKIFRKHSCVIFWDLHTDENYWNTLMLSHLYLMGIWNIACCCIHSLSCPPALPPVINTVSQFPWELWPLCTLLLP